MSNESIKNIVEVGILLENTREDAQKALTEALRVQSEAKSRLAYAVATVAAEKANLMAADGNVLLARATLTRLGGAAPAASNKGSGQSEVQAAVRAILLAAAPNGLVLDEIYARLQEQGVEMGGANPRDNLGAYLSRWSKVPEFGVENRGRGVWGSTLAAEPSPEVPAFLASVPEVPASDAAPDAAVPAFLAPAESVSASVPVTPDVEGPEGLSLLPEGFPGRDALTEAGIVNIEDLTGKTHDQLRRIKGVGAGTARDILAALEA